MIEQFVNFINIEVIICLAGITLFSCWLLSTSLGRKSLANSAPRRNNMPIYLPFIPLIIWFGPVALMIFYARMIAGKLVFSEASNQSGLLDWQNVFLDNLVLCTGSVITIAVIVFLARATFARRLKGFGLNVKTIHKDFLAAPVFLLSIWPLLLGMIILTTYLGTIIWGQDFHMPRHEELQKITTHTQLPLRMLVIITAVIMAPVLEEALFRGLFQTMIRSFLIKPWPSIAISSMIFAMVHANAEHWPALFVLALCLGYSYEKSGSLFQPIFIHCLFNAISITAVLNQN